MVKIKMNWNHQKLLLPYTVFLTSSKNLHALFILLYSVTFLIFQISRMNGTRHFAKYLCRKCSKNISLLRPFHSVSDARDYHGKVSSLDVPHAQNRSEVSWLAFLTNFSDLDIQETINSFPTHEKKITALQLLLTQPCYQKSWGELREVLGGILRDKPSCKTTLLTAMITYFSLG
jgi:hypothetical protein